MYHHMNVAEAVFVGVGVGVGVTVVVTGTIIGLCWHKLT